MRVSLEVPMFDKQTTHPPMPSGLYTDAVESPRGFFRVLSAASSFKVPAFLSKGQGDDPVPEKLRLTG